MRVDELERELRAERPEVDHEFARRLDDWAAAGFPRGGWRSRGGLVEKLGRLRDRLRATPPRRLLLPTAAMAAFVLVAGVGIRAIDRTGGSNDALTTAAAPPSPATS